MKKKFILYFGILFFYQILILAIADSNQWWIKGKFYESIKGNLIVASPNIYDSKFKESVIVIFENTKDMSWGLTINKYMGLVSLRNFLNKSELIKMKEKKILDVKIPIYWGGPVEQQRYFILHSKDYKNENTKVYKNFFMTSDTETLIKIAENKGPKNKLIIVGISSWGEGQLEGEMERNDWLISKIDENFIFEEDKNKIWKFFFSKGFLRL